MVDGGTAKYDHYSKLITTDESGTYRKSRHAGHSRTLAVSIDQVNFFLNSEQHDRFHAEIIELGT
jgi:hypothetical protein